ncbi:MAG: FHA domain-containing protein [Pseudomonadota bacterium]
MISAGTTRTLELNNAGITVHDGTQVLLESPGYALVKGEGPLVLGDEARLRSRLNPRHTLTQFWDQLSADPTSKSQGQRLHHTDIAYAHLTQIWEKIKSDTHELILILPGSFNKQQLALLLGLTRACSMPITGLVDSAVAACSDSCVGGNRLYHLDMQLNAIVLTQLAVDNELKRTKVSRLDKTGLLQLNELWANTIADSLVRKTRFDPMHLAQTEQQLYDQIPHWLARLRKQENIVVEMGTGSRSYSITLNKDDIENATAGIYRQIVQFVRSNTDSNEPLILLLSHRLRDLPGFCSSMEALEPIQIIQLPHQAAALGALKHRSHICTADPAPHFVTQLPYTPTAPPKTDSPPPPNSPSHILYGSRAYPINECPLVLGTNISKRNRGCKLSGALNGISRQHCSIYFKKERVWLEDHSTWGTFLNNDKIDGRSELRTGDRIRIGTPGQELMCIRIMDSHESSPT